MKFSRIPALALFGLIAACGGGDQEAETAEAPPTTMTPEAEIEALADYFETHYNMHHASMVADLYADDAVQLYANGIIAMGKDAITAAIEEQMTSSPELTITQADRMVFGDLAVARGTYDVTVTPEGGEPMSYGGAYLTMLNKDGDDWKIGGGITNYTAQMPPELWTPGEEEGEPPAEEGTMGEFFDNLTTHFNLGHASMVADLYTEDGTVAFANTPIATGRAEILASLEGRLAQGSPQITIHDVGTNDLGGGWATDGGWYELTAEGESGPVRSMGAYMGLFRQVDGEWKAHWVVTNGGPVQ